MAFFLGRVIMHPIGTIAISNARMIQSATSFIVMSSPNDVEIPTLHFTIGQVCRH